MISSYRDAGFEGLRHVKISNYLDRKNQRKGFSIENEVILKESSIAETKDLGWWFRRSYRN